MDCEAEEGEEEEEEEVNNRDGYVEESGDL